MRRSDICIINKYNITCGIGPLLYMAVTCGSGPLLCMAVTSLKLLLKFLNNLYCTIHNTNTLRGLEYFRSSMKIFSPLGKYSQGLRTVQNLFEILIILL